ncbi:uncharacterized protein LOC120085494 [Benincasa hispida]|uniref:uncharacterized protein LOC120085494 n=1 Tax=Benincasa hispida TaxID=102211 RepID=UPI001900FD14|nr:uncharacterized protein LOC120085494 [Benincasa hispida]
MASEMLKQLDVYIFSLIAFAIWHEHNQLVFYGQIFPFFHSIWWAVNLVESINYQPELVPDPSSRSPSLIMLAPHWSTPPPDSFKVNSDTAYLDGKVIVDAIVCDSCVDVMLIMESHFPLMGSVDLAEAIAMFIWVSNALDSGIPLFGLKLNPTFFGTFWFGIIPVRMKYRLSLRLLEISIVLTLSLVFHRLITSITPSLMV